MLSSLDLESHCDESGDSRQERLCIVAGLVGSTRQWRLFERRWTRATHGRVFHSKEFFARKGGKRVGKYADWTDARATKYITSLCDVVLNGRLTIIGALVDVPAFMARNAGERRFLTAAPYEDRPTGGVWRGTGAPSKPYFLGFSTCIAQAIQCKKRRSGGKVHYWFDRQDDYEGLAKQTFSRVAAMAVPWIRGCRHLVYADKAEYPGLQAADLIAYTKCAIEQDNPTSVDVYRTSNYDLYIAAKMLKTVPRQNFFEWGEEEIQHRLSSVPIEVRRRWSTSKLRGIKTGRRARGGRNTGNG